MAIGCDTLTNRVDSERLDAKWMDLAISDDRIQRSNQELLFSDCPR